MAEKRTIELEIQDNTKSLKQQYREAVQELQAISEQYGNTSKEAAAAAQKAADLKDQIAFSKDLVDAFNPDAKFKAVEGAVNGALNGFQAFEGGLALIGIESEDLQKTMVKLQAVMALTQGINGVMEAGDSFKILGTKAMDAFKGMTTASKVFSVTGIGLLITGVGLLVSNFDTLKEKVLGITAAQKALTSATAEGATAMSNAKMTVNEVGIAFEQAKKGVISKEQALKIYNDKLGQTLGTTDDFNEAEKTFADKTPIYLKAVQARATAQALANEAAKEMAKSVLAEQENNLTMMDQIGVAAEASIFGLNGITGAADRALELQKKRTEEAKQKAKTNYEAINKLSEGFLKDALALESQLSTGTDDEEKKRSERTIQNTINTVNKVEKTNIDVQRRIEDEKLRIMEDGRAKELEANRVNYERKIQDAEKELANDVDKKNKLKQLSDQYAESKRADEKAINDKYDKLDEDTRLQREEEFKKNRLATKNFNIEIISEEKKAEVELEMEAYEKKKAIKEQEKQDEIQRNKERLQIAKDGLQLVSAVMDLFGKQDERRARLAFTVDKAAKISSATIAGYEAVMEAYKTGQKSPLTAVFPAYPYVQAGLAGAFAAVNIAKIGQSKFSASSSMSAGDKGGGGGGTTLTPQFSTIGSSGINQLAQLQQKPTQAYVVSGEVTSAQALDRNRVQNATL